MFIPERVKRDPRRLCHRPSFRLAERFHILDHSLAFPDNELYARATEHSYSLAVPCHTRRDGRRLIRGA